MTDNAATDPATNPNAVGRPMPTGALEVFENRLLDVPEAGGDGIEGILATIAAATTAMELDAAWQSNGLGVLANTPIVIQSIERIESTFADSPLGWFLVVRGAIAATGEAFVATTGSVSVVGQLAQAHHMGWFPLKCVLRSKESKQHPGAFVQHLEMVK